MNNDPKPSGYENYACIGGVNEVAVWVRHRRNGEDWDIILVHPDRSKCKFDIYLTRDREVKHNQRLALIEFMSPSNLRTALSGDGVYRILLLIKLFAPRMFRGNVNPAIVRYMREKEKEMSNANT